MANMSMKINRELPFDKLYDLTKRIDSLRKAEVAELWVLGNNVITEKERCECLRSVYFKKALVYGKLCSSEVHEVPKFDSIHKIHIDGVKELKVG